MSAARPSHAGKTYDVVIIGGGVAGLTAGAELSKTSLDVCLLEARDRLGGRVWTHPTLKLDLGASWIHGHIKNPIYEMAKSAGVALKRTDYENGQMYDHKGELSDREEAAWEGAWETVADKCETRAEALADKGDAKTSLGDLIDAATAHAKPADKAAVEFMACVEVEHEFGGDVQHLAAAFYDEGEDLRGEDYVFPDGYGQIVDLLAAQYKGTVHLKAVVDTVAYGTGEGVVVTLRDGTEVHAKAAIVAVPLGVLKNSVAHGHGHAAAAGAAATSGGDGTVPNGFAVAGSGIKFSPELPAEYVHSINAIGVGLLQKHAFEFPRTVWPTSYDMFNFVDREAGPKQRFPEALNWSHYVPARHALIWFSAGSIAEEQSHRPEGDVKKDLIAQMKKHWPSLPEPTAFLRTAWNLDPFACGSYSFLACGAKPSDRVVFQRPVASKGTPVGAMWFAGEHVSKDYPATVQGAYLTGKDAAAKVAHALAAGAVAVAAESTGASTDHRRPRVAAGGAAATGGSGTAAAAAAATRRARGGRRRRVAADSSDDE